MGPTSKKKKKDKTSNGMEKMDREGVEEEIVLFLFFLT